MIGEKVRGLGRQVDSVLSAGEEFEKRRLRPADLQKLNNRSISGEWELERRGVEEGVGGREGRVL